MVKSYPFSLLITSVKYVLVGHESKVGNRFKGWLNVHDLFELAHARARYFFVAGSQADKGSSREREERMLLLAWAWRRDTSLVFGHGEVTGVCPHGGGSKDHLPYQGPPFTSTLLAIIIRVLWLRLSISLSFSPPTTSRPRLFRNISPNVPWLSSTLAHRVR